jgi:2-oxoglutarate ferredoxin oxidoreductase subunit beta
MSSAESLTPITDDIKKLLRLERLPHIWCGGCGIGVAMKAYIEAVLRSGMDVDKHVLVSGIGCSSRMPGYVKLDGYHVTHGRGIPFAVGLKTARPDLEVTVFAGDGDLVTIGGNHFIHAIRRNDDINVIMINNFTYGMTGGQYGGTTPRGSRTLTSPYGHIERSFNIPYMAASLGASYVARWSPLHYRELTKTILEMFEVDGFAIVEVVSPCIMYTGMNAMEAVHMMKTFRERCVINHNADLSKIDIPSFKEDKPIVLGNFLRREVPSFQTLYREEIIKKARGR